MNPCWRTTTVMAVLFLLFPMTSAMAQGMSDRSLQRSVTSPEQFVYGTVGLMVGGSFSFEDRDSDVGRIEDGDNGLDLSVSGWMLGGGMHLPIGSRAPGAPIGVGIRVGAQLEGMTFNVSIDGADEDISESWVITAGQIGPALSYHVEDLGLSIMLSGLLGAGVGFGSSSEGIAMQEDDDSELEMMLVGRAGIELGVRYQPGRVGGMLAFGRSWSIHELTFMDAQYRSGVWNLNASVTF